MDGQLSQMLHTNFHGNRSTGSGREIFEVFLPYTVQSRFFFTSPLNPAENCSETSAIPLTCPLLTLRGPRRYIELPV